jgi:demethylmenaquinone methyltransferase/2-methoxy-6-polyprenyl-1,4-benzoquinol methylase
VVETAKNRQAAALFDAAAEGYDAWARVFSFGQYGRWHRALIDALAPTPAGLVLDVCTGTASVAIEIARRRGSRVVGIDISPGMLAEGRRRVEEAGLDRMVTLQRGRAEAVPYPDATFDAVAVSFLLRYVEDMDATMREVVRALKPGGRLALLEFGVPRPGPLRWAWTVYTRAVMPAATLPLSPGWRHVGSFLGPSISSFYRGRTVDDLRRLLERAGLEDVRSRALSLGGAVVLWGDKSR